MWIGESETWHGELDILAGNKSTCVLIKSNEADDDDDKDDPASDSSEDQAEENSPGHRTNYGRFLYQVMAQSVVFAWTEFNKHPELHSYIPTVFFARDKFMIFIYNPMQDELLAVGYSELSFEAPYRKIFWLWIVLNHRLFFC